MLQYDETIKEFRQKISRKKHLEAMLEDLNKQKYDLEDEVRILKIRKNYEQKDVDRLEGRSLSAFFYGVIGKKDEKLEKERSEAYAAAVKYDSGVRELEYVETAIRNNTQELESLAGCEEKYEKLLSEKASLIKEQDDFTAHEITKLEERISDAENQKKEIAEAVYVGEKAAECARAVISKLGDAENYGVWDLVGGGIISDIAKHGALDEAQELIEELQIQLRKFKTELADVTINDELKIDISEFLRFADYFFDNLFSDWMVLKKIQKSLEQVKSVHKSIENVLDTLGEMYAKAEAEYILSKEKLDNFIIGTDI